MPTVIPFDRSSAVCMCAFKPKGTFIDDLVELLVYFANCLEVSGSVQTFILRSIHGNVVVCCGVWTTRRGEETAIDFRNGLTAEERRNMLSPLAEIIGPFWYDICCGENNSGLPSAKISLGDIVTIRLCVTEIEKQDSLCYACLAILKSYFSKSKGLLSYTCFRSLQGDQVLGLGVWKELKDAYASILDSCPHFEKSTLEFVADLVLNSRYDLMEVVYATADDNLPPLQCFPKSLPFHGF